MADRVGQPFGQYRLSRFLGQGSFGEVYLGEHLYSHTQAAVKVLQARLTAEDLKEFINEASTTFRLQHPHIVRLLDFGIDPENTPFLVMVYASGGTLRKLHPKGTRLPLESIIASVSPIAAALQYAHDQRLIHRDVKPENILLGPNNEVWLSDFGITSVAHSTRSLDTEKPGGTVPYMAPEQLRGKARPASDQYALGIMVYEWLCGERPFGGTTTEIAMQHFLEPPPSLREKIPTLSPDVEQVVMKALAKDPMQRFVSVQAFATALEQAGKVDQPHSLILPQPLTMTSSAVPLSQQAVGSLPVEGVQILPTPPDQSKQGVSSSRLQMRSEPVRQGISRRAMLLSLGTAGLAVVSSGLIWLLSSRSSHPTPGAWYDGNYLYKKSITIDHTKVSGGSDLMNFPALIELADPHLKTAGNGGYVQNSNGYDILFTDSTETVKLDHEIETYNASTGEIKMWVRIPTLSATTDTVISMYFDNSSVSSSQENKTGVWDSNYKGVWHMADNAANTAVADSTSNANTGVNAANTNTKTTTGRIDGALSYNGSSDKTTISNSISLASSSFTVEFWAKRTASSVWGIVFGQMIPLRLIKPYLLVFVRKTRLH